MTGKDTLPMVVLFIVVILFLGVLFLVTTLFAGLVGDMKTNLDQTNISYKYVPIGTEDSVSIEHLCYNGPFEGITAQNKVQVKNPREPFTYVIARGCAANSIGITVTSGNTTRSETIVVDAE